MKKTGSKRLKRSILGEVGDAAQKTPLPKQLHIVPKSLALKVKMGSFYEIDHSKLPPSTPPMLHSIRVVMVSAKTELNVTVRYPSTDSLEAYFGNTNSIIHRNKLYPSLDEKFVMRPELAVEVLGREILAQEFGEHWHSKSFWLMDCFGTEKLPSPVSVCDAKIDSYKLPSPVSVCDAEADFKVKNGPLLYNLQSSGVKGWGYQRLVAYLRKPDVHEEVMNVSHSDGKRKGRHEIKDKDIIQYTRKRKVGRPAKHVIKKIKHTSKPKPIDCKPKIKSNKETEYVERWCRQRYEASAKKLWEVLKANKAVYGNPISRYELRAQARSRIGDTGLLDHMLKHLAGKVVPDGNERLRRRCDAEGTMEYWLESADLVHIRKEVGVQDPYWTPPPRWKVGDSLPTKDCLCGKEVRLLKEELSSMRRQIEALKSKDKEEHAITMVLPFTAASSVKLNNDTLNVTTSQEMYERLLKKKSAMEEQLVEISKALLKIKEGMKMISCHSEAPEKQHSMVLVNCKSLPGEVMNNSSTTSIENFDEAASGKARDSNAEREWQAGERTRLIRLKPCRHLQSCNLSSQAVGI